MKDFGENPRLKLSKSREKEGLKVEAFFITVGIFIVLFFIYCLVVSNLFTVFEISVESEKLPGSFDGYRMVLLTDLHDKQFGRNNRRLIEKVRSLSPDLILFGGDMHETLDDRAFFALIQNLSQIAPVVSSEGNHDFYYHLRPDYSEYIKNAEKCGLVNLGGRIFIDGKNGEKIALTGESYHAYIKDKITFDDRYFNVFLLHNPFCFDDLQTKPDLMLSGHVHGGFVRLPFVGGIFAPGAGISIFKRFSPQYFFPRYTKGMYGEKDGKLVVSQGLGLSARLPVRMIPPEIVCVTLRRAD